MWLTVLDGVHFHSQWRQPPTLSVVFLKIFSSRSRSLHSNSRFRIFLPFLTECMKFTKNRQELIKNKVMQENMEGVKQIISVIPCNLAINVCAIF
jgi:hypothetical protein